MLCNFIVTEASKSRSNWFKQKNVINMFLKTFFFQKLKQTFEQNDFNKKRPMEMQNLRKLIGPIIIETNSREYKIKFTGGSQNFTNSFTTAQCSRHNFYKMLSARALNHHLVLIWTLIRVKTINFNVIIAIRHKKSIKCTFISPWEVIETCHYPVYFIRLQKKGQIPENINFGQKGQWSR